MAASAASAAAAAGDAGADPGDPDVAGASFPGWTYFAGSFICAALWPALSFMLLLPQRQAEMKDENRPI